MAETIASEVLRRAEEGLRQRLRREAQAGDAHAAALADLSTEELLRYLLDKSRLTGSALHLEREEAAQAESEAA